MKSLLEVSVPKALFPSTWPTAAILASFPSALWCLWCLSPSVLGFFVLLCFGGTDGPGAGLAQEGHLVRPGLEDVLHSVVNDVHSELLILVCSLLNILSLIHE